MIHTRNLGLFTFLLSRIFTIQFLSVLLFTGLSSAADVKKRCETCWDESCVDMKGAVPRCSRLEKPSKTKSGGAACKEGTVVSADTQGHCCWAGQAWNGSQCIGKPTSCPEGYEITQEQQSCALTECPAGKARSKGSIGCCWPKQLYSKQQKRCIGLPHCPAGMVSTADELCRDNKVEEQDQQAIIHFFQKYGGLHSIRWTTNDRDHRTLRRECEIKNPIDQTNAIIQTCKTIETYSAIQEEEVKETEIAQTDLAQYFREALLEKNLQEITHVFVLHIRTSINTLD